MLVSLNNDNTCNCSVFLVYVYIPFLGWCQVSETAELYVRGSIHQNALKQDPQFSKCRPLGWVGLPAVQHHLIATDMTTETCVYDIGVKPRIHCVCLYC